MTCEHCQQQLLPYLYDVLEPQERDELTAHLEACPLCQEALKLAKEQQGQFADAVKEPQPGIVFKAPPMVIPVSSAPTVAMQAPSRSIRFFSRWIIAAAIVGVILAGAGVVGGVIYRDQRNEISQREQRLAQARAELKQSQDDLNKAKKNTQHEIQNIQKEIDKLFDEWKSDETRVRKVLQDKGAQLRVTGPPSAVAGGKNSFEVELTQEGVQQNFFLKQMKLPGLSPMQARVVDQKNRAPLTDWTNLKADANNRLNYMLPPDLPQPGQQIALEFQAETEDGTIYHFNDNLTVAAPEYVTHLTTDRPLYRPGQTVRFRSLTLNRFSLKPAREQFHLRFRIAGPDNQEWFNKEFAGELVTIKNRENLKGVDGAPLQGIGAGEFDLPADAPTGHYTLTVSEVNDRFREEKRVFMVNRWQTPRFHKEVTFDRSSYGDGDRVRMMVRVAALQTPAGNRAGIRVQANTNVDGFSIHEQHLETDRDGLALFEFTLPEQITRGVGTVTLKFEDGPNQETIQRSLPLTVRDLDVDFYPEGGDLIIGAANRVYFQARTKTNRPADIEGRIVDDTGAVVARVQTVTDSEEPGINQGLGSFTFTPKLKRRYSLRIDAPIGIQRPFPLPAAKTKGVVMRIAPGVIEHDIDLTLHNANVNRTLLVGAYCRGRWIAHKDNIHVQANSTARVKWQLPTGVAGVYRITVFERKGLGGDATFLPLAERLVYRKGPEHVDVDIVNERPSYYPGQNVRLRLEARNEIKQFVPAYALVAVVDQSVLKLADDKTTRSLPTHFLLTTEVRDPEDLEYTDVLLGSHPKAALALDLLLGCQGWRRFAEQDPEMFQRRQKDAKAPPVFLANSMNVKQFFDNEQKQIDKLDQNYVVKAIDLQKKLGAKEQTEDGPPDLLQGIERRRQSVDNAEHVLAEAQVGLRRTRMVLVQFGLGSAMLLALFVVFYLLNVGLHRLAQGGSPRVWFTAGLSLFALLFFASIIGTLALKGERFFDFDNGRWGAKMAAPNAPPPNEKAPLRAPPPLEVDDDPQMEIAAQVGGPQKAKDMRQPRQKAIAEPNWNNNWNIDVVNQQIGPRFDRISRQKGDYQAILLAELGRRVQLPATDDPCIVREYAHRRAFTKGEARRDFSETLYWHPALVMADGRAEVDFDLSDAVTRFEVLVLSNTTDGRLGANRAFITATLPVSVEPKAPLELSKSDALTLPVTVCNDSSKDAALTLITRVKGLTALDAGAERGLTLKANEKSRQTFRFKPSIDEGQANLRLITKLSNSADAVERNIKVVPDGFPITESVSGILDRQASHDIVLPEDGVLGTLKVQAHFYPSPLAELQAGADWLHREPIGGFEAICSSVSLDAHILRWLEENKIADPSVENQARTRLRAGLPKLATFECVAPDRGAYEWFSSAVRPDAALTAYGLLQFQAARKLNTVEPALLERTEKYLLDQLGRKPDAVTKATIVWALTESNPTVDLDKELTALRDDCRQSKDPYLHALVALGQLNRKRSDDAMNLLRRVRELQRANHDARDFLLADAADMKTKTTALALLGWTRGDGRLWQPPQFTDDIKNAQRWLQTQRRGPGDFGSPQATVFALHALAAQRLDLAPGGTIEISTRGNPDMPRNDPPFRGGAVGISNVNPNQAQFAPNTRAPITLTLREASTMTSGKNTVHLTITNRVMPYTLTWSYRVTRLPVDPRAPIKLTTKLDKDEVNEGDTVKLTATADGVLAWPGIGISVIGIPAGLTLDKTEQLDHYKKNGDISAWELRGRELFLYAQFGKKMAVDLDLTATVPGDYRGPASRAYSYHDTQRKFWVNPLRIRIQESSAVRAGAKSEAK